jgi:hypothetical protein
MFEFSLLSSTPNGPVRHADLLKAGGAFHAKQTGAKPEGEPLEMFQLGDVRTELGSAFEEFSDVGVSGDRYLTILSRPVPRLIVFDLVEWRVACAIANPRDGAAAVSVTTHTDGRFVTQTNRDGGMHVYSCENGGQVLSGAYIDDEFIVMDRHGYFDGSDDAAAYVELTIPGLPGRHLLSQFIAALKRPGIATEVLNGTAPDKGPALEAPPVLRSSAGAIEAFSQSGLSYIQLYADGRALRRVDATSQSASLLISDEELSRHRSLSVVAVGGSGHASAPMTIVGKRTGQAQLGRIFVLAVGVDSYPNIENADLNFAVSDARRIAAAVEASPLYERGSSTILADAKADAAAIQSALDRIVAAAGPEDTIVISFAGHGVIDGGQLRLLLSGTSLDELGKTSLAFGVVADKLKGAKARVVLFLDVCHAGLSDRASVAANDDAVNRLTTSAGAGMVILSASKGRQESQERASADGGLFSVALDRVLTSERKQFDGDGNGAISLDELYRGVKALVVRDTAGRQTPWLTRNQTFGDFDLF